MKHSTLKQTSQLMDLGTPFDDTDDLKYSCEYPLVTIVTPSFNQGHFIRDTIESVLSQDYPNLEYLVFDGGSTDETQEVLRSYGSRLHWISEKDQGQADAVNKGFQQAKGEIFGWLNSDDTYLPGAIQKAVEFFQANPAISMVYGEAYIADAQGKIIERFHTEAFDYQRLAETCFIVQPTVFIRRHVFEVVGPLDVSLHCALDYEYWMRVGKRFRVGCMPQLLATTRVHGAAKTVAKKQEAHQEIVSIVQRHYSLVPLRAIYLYTYVTLMEKLMPNVQGLYPNGWATSHVTIFLRGYQSSSVFLHVKGHIRNKNQPLTLRIMAGGKTVERQIPAGEDFLLSEIVTAHDEIQIDSKEMSRRCDPCATRHVYAPSPEERHFSYHLARGCMYTIRTLTIIDETHREKSLYSMRARVMFFLALPVFIISNTLRFNRCLLVREQFKALFRLCQSVFAGLCKSQR